MSWPDNKMAPKFRQEKTIKTGSSIVYYRFSLCRNNSRSRTTIVTVVNAKTAVATYINGTASKRHIKKLQKL